MAPTPKMPSGMAGLDAFAAEPEDRPADFSDAESFFNLPQGDDDEDQVEDDKH
jgi:hypothetical protein